MAIKFRKELCPSDSNGFLTDVDLRNMDKNGSMRSCRLEWKLDGSRYLLHLHKNGNHLTSRRSSVKTGQFVDRIDQTPKFKKLKADDRLDGVVIDGEVMAPFEGGVRAVTSIIGSLPAKAIEKQKEKGWLYIMAFDLLFDGEEDLRQKPFGERRKRLEEIIKYIWEKYPKLKKYVRLIRQVDAQSSLLVQERFMLALKKGYEGLMIKDVLSPVGVGMWKWKVQRDACAIISGFTEGTGKYAGQIGALKFSVYRPVDHKKRMTAGEAELELVEVGQCSGMTDEQRAMFSKKPKKYIGKVIEIRGQEFTGDRVRHPRFMRLRDDYPPMKCTLDKFTRDMLFQSQAPPEKKV